MPKTECDDTNFGLKAQLNIAQGNALGDMNKNQHAPCKGS